MGTIKDGEPVYHQFIIIGDTFDPTASHKADLRLNESLVSRPLLMEFTMLEPFHWAYYSSIHFHRHTSLEVGKKIKACTGSCKLNFSVTAQGDLELKDHWNGPASLANGMISRVDDLGKP
ncbi:hypothetical protein BTVI_158350 [Pitangus sulphuratus]|nr:hypothetical protein BTVI_158350 [Pitangus sulphuratus]